MSADDNASNSDANSDPWLSQAWATENGVNIGGRRYVPSPGAGYLNPTMFDGYGNIPALKQVANNAVASVVNIGGQEYVPYDVLMGIQEAARPYARQPSGLDKFIEGLAGNMPMLLGGAFLGPIAGAAGATGGSAFADLLSQFGVSNPFSSLGNIFGGGGSGAGGGAGGNMDWTDILSDVDNWDLMGDLSQLGGDTSKSVAAAVDAAKAGNTSALEGLLQKIGPRALTSLIGSGVQGLSSLLASRAQQQAGNQATGTLAAQYAQNRADLTPYREAGYRALDRLSAMTTPGNQFTTMQADPGYQFRFDQGENALNNRLKAGGKFYSGSALKAGQDYAQGLASQEFGNVFNRNAAMSGIGQTATNTGVQSGMSLSNLLANNQTDMGNARASGYVGLGNAVQGGINSHNNAEMTNAFLQLLAGNRDVFRADGGPVIAGKPYVVGERGPEVIIPQENGTVVPNNFTQNNFVELQKIQEKIDELKKKIPQYNSGAQYAYDVSTVFGGFGPQGKAKLLALEHILNMREQDLEYAKQQQLDLVRKLGAY